MASPLQLAVLPWRVSSNARPESSAGHPVSLCVAPNAQPSPSPAKARLHGVQRFSLSLLPWLRPRICPEPASPRHRSSLACPSARRVSPLRDAPGMLAGAQLHRAPISTFLCSCAPCSLPWCAPQFAQPRLLPDARSSFLLLYRAPLARIPVPSCELPCSLSLSSMADDSPARMAPISLLPLAGIQISLSPARISLAAVVLSVSTRDRGRVHRVRQRFVVDSIVVAAAWLAACSRLTSSC
jgi:hypothetical protein